MSVLRELAPYGELIFVVCQLLMGAVMIFLSAKFASKRDVSGAQKRADEAHHRIDLVEKDIKGLPDFDTVNDLKRDIATLRELSAGNGTKIEMVQGTLQRIDDFLRSRP